MKLFDISIVRWFASLIGLKAIYQTIYIIFNLIVIKKLAVAEYGLYAYILAFTVYFSSIPLLGFPVYLQKNAARSGTLNIRYFLITAILSIASLMLAFYLMPKIVLYQKIEIIFIILVNCLLTTAISVNDGLGKYTFQYKFMLFSSMWMIYSILTGFVWAKNISLTSILNYWLINSVASFLVLLVLLYQLFTQKIKFDNCAEHKLPTIAMDLMFLYSIALPDGFARFYDRYLANEFLTNEFLGSYSFNLMVVTTIYALFVRPLNSILVTHLAKVHTSTSGVASVIKKYYLASFTIYVICFLMYAPFSTPLLHLVGLEKYDNTLYMFFICFFNAAMYLLSIPFISLITLDDNRSNKFLYCFASLLIFNIPLFMLLFSRTEAAFFLGFMCAYAINFLLSISFQKQSALYCFKSMGIDFKNFMHTHFIKLHNLIYSK